MHMFGVNPECTRNLYLWEEARVMTVGNDSKTGDKGATMMLVGYSKQESYCIGMWGMQTARGVETHDIICLSVCIFSLMIYQVY